MVSSLPCSYLSVSRRATSKQLTTNCIYEYELPLIVITPGSINERPFWPKYKCLSSNTLDIARMTMS